MNILIYSLVIFVIIYFLLSYISRASTKKISKGIRISIFLFSIILAILLAIGGRAILSLPLVLLSLGLIKLKGLTLWQIIGLFRLIQTLRRKGRFSFSQNNFTNSSSTLTLDEAYQILNLDKNKKISKEDVKKAHAKIQKKIHPDISPETSRLSSLVNEAKDLVLNDLS